MLIGGPFLGGLDKLEMSATQMIYATEPDTTCGGSCIPIEDNPAVDVSTHCLP